MCIRDRVNIDCTEEEAGRGDVQPAVSIEVSHCKVGNLEAYRVEYGRLESAIPIIQQDRQIAVIAGD